MARRLRKHSTRAKLQPVDPVFEIIQHLTEASPLALEGIPKLIRANRKSRHNICSYNFSNLQMKRTTGGPDSDRVSFELTFTPGLIGALQTQKQPKVRTELQADESNEMINFILPMMMAAKAELNNAEPDHQKPKKTKNKKATKEDDPFEAYARKLWESMSNGLSCSCRKEKLLNALQKDRETLERNELHLRAQIGSYKMFQSVMTDEFQKQDVGVVLVADDDTSERQSALKYKLEKKTPGNSADIEALADLMKQLRAYL